MSAAVLTISRNGETVRSQRIEGESVLGRGEGCVIRLDDRAISRQHAVFKPSGDGVQVEKKSEFAPLIVNGAECTRAVLKEGDVVSIGPYLIQLTLPENKPVKQNTLSLVKAPEVPQAVEPQPATSASLKLEEPVPDFSAELPSSDVLFGSPDQNHFEQPKLEVTGQIDVTPQLSVGTVSLSPPSPAVEGMDADLVVPMGEVVAPVDEEAKTKMVSVNQVAAKLIFKAGDADVNEFEIKKDEITLGRGKDCDVSLLDKKSSRKNTVIQRVGSKFVIKDLSSANGTYVNGTKIREFDLSSNDQIKIGDTEFIFQAQLKSPVDAPEDFAKYLAESAEVAPGGTPISGEMQAASLEALAGNYQAASEMVAAQQAEVPQQPPALPSVEASDIPGILGVQTEPKKSATLIGKYLEKFRALPKARQFIWIGIIAGGLYLFMELGEDEEGVKKKKAGSKKPVATATAKNPGDKGPNTFDSLTPDQKRYIEAQHSLAFDYYRNKDYDMALNELSKIFSLIPDYKDSREIERYAKEGKRKMEAIEEERRRKEDELKLKAKIASLLEETRQKMEKKQYELAKELFTQILAIDPDNPSIGAWKKIIEDHEESLKLVQQQKNVQEEINRRAWDIFKEGQELMRRKKYHSAIEVLGKVADVGASDTRAMVKAKVAISQCRAAISSRREPLLAEAKKREDAGEFAMAYQLYQRATVVDPPHPAGYQGMRRVHGVLHDRSKVLYTEAILAESYSDFATAQTKYREVLKIAPKDDIYYQRAQRKLGNYTRYLANEPLGAAGGGSTQ